jgi:SAM-dependent methyltransferase
VDEQRIRVGRELAGGRNITMITGDIFAEPPPFAGTVYDLVVLHDVFEHLERKEDMLGKLAEYIAPGGRLLITFPPYYSAFGAHQQHLPFRYARLPFYHLIPGALGPLLCTYAQEFEPAVSEVRKLHRLKMGLRSFERIVLSARLRIVHRRAYLLSPNFIRFGLPALPAGPLASVPGVNELLCTGVVYLLARP